MATARPAFIVAGTRSGCGKTTVTLALMAALAEQGMVVQPFKCGPDFIDPTLHRQVTGRVSRNLDVRMCGPAFVSSTFAAHAPEQGISIIEGVMGLFDGGEGSAARLASLLGLPVLLVVDVRSAAESVAAVVKGFETLDPRVQVAAVIFNRVGSGRHRQLIIKAVRHYCSTAIIGALPREAAITMPSRHLGLHMGPEMALDTTRLVSLVNDYLNLPCLLDLVRNYSAEQPGCSEAPALPRSPGRPVRLGVARDEAFCFYYQDNLDMLQQAGAELVFFSPLHDADLPPALDGLYLGGGYPELHAAQLSGNVTMREQIRAFSRAGRPVYAECGGFMYLTRAITDTHGEAFAMVGVFPVRATMDKRLRRLGYRQVQMRADTLLGRTGELCYGHEFHYSTVEAMPAAFHRAYDLDDNRCEGYLVDQTLAGYIHLHWGKTPLAACYFVEAMRSAEIQGTNK